MRCEVLIDWLTFSVKTEKPDEVIRDYLNMDPDLFQDLGYSINGYQKCKAFSNIMVCYDGRENDFFHDMGVCVSLSGQGCRAFETYSKHGGTDDNQQGSVPFMKLFQQLDGTEDAHITRLDVACDDKSGILDMNELYFRYKERLIRSRCNRKTFDDGQDGKKDSGQTLYIGAASSSFRTRIYDKAMEQGVEGPWIRVEMVLKGKNGDSFVHQLVNGVEVGCLASQVLNDKLQFIEDDDSNISRCSVCGWWQKFVEEVEKVRLVARCTVQHSVQNIGQWVRTQVGPSLYILAETIGFRAVYDMAQEAKDRLTRKQEALIADWNSIQRASIASAISPPALPQVSAAV